MKEYILFNLDAQISDVFEVFQKQGISRMKSLLRLISIFAMAIGVMLLILGCSNHIPQIDNDQTVASISELFPVTITDSNGTDLVFDKPPERIVVFDAAALEILFAIGEEDRIIATHSFVSYPPETDTIPRVGDAFNMDIEAIIAMEPDLVFIFAPTFLEQLKNTGLKVLYLQTLEQNFEKTTENIRMWGLITGNMSNAEIVASDFETRVENIKQIFSTYSTTHKALQDIGDFWTPGSDTLMGEVFTLLKLRNVAHDISGYSQISPEVIVQRDPEIIMTVNTQLYLDNPAFRDLFAVKNKRVIEFDPTLLSVAGPRFVDGLENLAKLIYPELFN